MNTSRKVWFPKKTVGYGWGMPTCWQGFVVVFGYIALLIVGAIIILNEPKNAGYYFLYMLATTSILLFITWLKGEKLNQPEE